MGKRSAARKSFEYDDLEEDNTESKQEKMRNQSRRQHRRVQNALNSRDVEWLEEIEDDL